MTNKLFGYFDSAVSDKATYDPGLGVDCLFCSKPLSKPMKTTSIMKDGDSKSYFYRTHKDCYDSASEEDITLYESSLIDSLPNGDKP